MINKKDILFLCQYFYPEYVSSATLPYDTAIALVKAGFSVSVLCGYPKEYNNIGDVPGKEIHSGIEIRRLKYLQLKRDNFIRRIINYLSFLIAVFANFFYLNGFKSVVVYSNPPILPLVAAWACKIFKIKMVFVCYDVYPEIAFITKTIPKNGIVSKVMGYINKNIYKNVHTVIALSNEMKEYLLSHRKDLKDNNVTVIPNWHKDFLLNDSEKSYENAKFLNLDLKNKFVVSYFGNMGICQDLDTIIDAIRILKKDFGIQFLFAGHGNKIAQLKKTKKEEYLDNTVIYDFLNGADFEDAINVSDVFLVSLVNELTGLAVPSKTYSYMMAAKPVIAIIGSNSDIAKDLLSKKAGFVFESGDVNGLVSAIKTLKNNEQLRVEMGYNSRKIFSEKHTVSKCTQSYIDLMHKVLEEKTNV